MESVQSIDDLVTVEQKLKIVNPPMVVYAHIYPEFKILQQSFEWTLSNFSPSNARKSKCRSPRFPVNFGGIIFENAQMVFYPKGDNTTPLRKTDNISFFLHVPSIFSKYRDAMHSKISLAIEYPVLVTRELFVSLKYLAAEEFLGFTGFHVDGNYEYKDYHGYGIKRQNVSSLKLSCKITTVIDPSMNMMKSLMTPEKLQADMGNLYKTQEMADVTFIIGNKKLPAHKCILASRCPVFKAMFQSQMKEATDNVVEITDVDYEIFDRFLHFIYSGKIEDTENDAEDLLALADKYDIKDLKRICEHRMAANLTTENATQMLVKADMYHSQVVKDAVINFFKSNM